MNRYIVIYFKRRGEFCEKKIEVFESDEALIKDRLEQQGIVPKLVKEEIYFKSMQEEGYKSIRLLEDNDCEMYVKREVYVEDNNW